MVHIFVLMAKFGHGCGTPPLLEIQNAPAGGAEWYFLYLYFGFLLEIENPAC
jgi:hypothetical protein